MHFLSVLVLYFFQSFASSNLLLVVCDYKLKVSAYSSFARTVGHGFEQHKMRLDGGTNEPLFTSVTRDFVGTLDYIFYTGELSCHVALSL